MVACAAQHSDEKNRSEEMTQAQRSKRQIEDHLRGQTVRSGRCVIGDVVSKLEKL